MKKLKNHIKIYKHFYAYGALLSLMATTYTALSGRIDGHERVITKILKTLENEEIIHNLTFEKTP